MSFLLGLRPRAAAAPPVQIYQYRVDGRPMRRGNATVYAARTPAGELVDLVCAPVDGAADRAAAQQLATREYDALAALAALDRTWRVQVWFPWNGYLVTPITVGTDGTSLANSCIRGEPGSGRPVPLVQWVFGDGTDRPDDEMAGRRAEQYPVVGSVLARCLSRTLGAPFTVAATRQRQETCETRGPGPAASGVAVAGEGAGCGVRPRRAGHVASVTRGFGF